VKFVSKTFSVGLRSSDRPTGLDGHFSGLKCSGAGLIGGIPD
jgi:hypothetical protein